MSQSVPVALQAPELVQFGTSFVKSEGFKTLFREGMSLVEETAAYLDGDGRAASVGFGRAASLAYASESMRLTTRLMQLASWLLVQRAVAEGEITSVQAAREKERVRLNQADSPLDGADFARLPERLREIVAQSLRLRDRIAHLDRLMASVDVQPQSVSPLAAQYGRLASAFGIAS